MSDDWRALDTPFYVSPLGVTGYRYDDDCFVWLVVAFGEANGILASARTFFDACKTAEAIEIQRGLPWVEAEFSGPQR